MSDVQPECSSQRGTFDLVSGCFDLWEHILSTRNAAAIKVDTKITCSVVCRSENILDLQKTSSVGFSLLILMVYGISKHGEIPSKFNSLIENAQDDCTSKCPQR